MKNVQPGFQLRDAKDMHIVSAAIYAGAHLIVTMDKDFDNEILSQHGLKALTPDEFVCRIADRLGVNGTVNAMLDASRVLFKNPQLKADEFAELLESRHGMVGTAELITNSF